MRGLIHVYTGNGKGKTTAAIGAGVRAVGHGWQVRMLQFLKGGDAHSPYGEVVALSHLPGFAIEQLGPSHFVHPEAVTEQDRAAVAAGLVRAREVLRSSDYSLVILDEINVVLALGLAKVEEVLELLNEKAKGTEVILTGRGAPQALVERADLVSSFEQIKHPYEQGVQARPGVEY